MSDWRQIQARIRKAKSGADPVAQLAALYERTRDAMVAFELARHHEKIGANEEAARWYTSAAERFRRAQWKVKAQEALTRLGAPIPASLVSDTSTTPAPAADSLSTKTSGSRAMFVVDSDDADDQVPLSSGDTFGLPSEENHAAASVPAQDPLATSREIPSRAPAGDGAPKKRRRRGRRGGRGRRRGSVVNPPLASPMIESPVMRPVIPKDPENESPPSELSAPSASASVRHASPSRTVAQPRTLAARSASREAVPEVPSESLPQLRGRTGDPGLSSRMAHLESQLRRLLACTPVPLDQADQAPAGPGVFIVSDSDQVTYYYVEACQTLRIGIANLLRAERSGTMRRTGGDSLRERFAEHLEINESKVSKYLKDHCSVRWIQLDDGARVLAHFAIAVLRPALND